MFYYTFQVWEAVCQVYQHVDERHDVFAGRGDGRAEEDSRGAGRDGKPIEVDGTNAGAAKQPPQKPQPG